MCEKEREEEDQKYLEEKQGKRKMGKSTAYDIVSYRSC